MNVTSGKAFLILFVGAIIGGLMYGVAQRTVMPTLVGAINKV